jgi:adenylate cyclase
MKVNLLLAAALAALFIWNPYPFQLLELKTFDSLIMSRDEVQDEMILLVDIDEDTVEKFGGYPLSRDVYAHLLTITQGVPGITVAFPDKDLHGKDEIFQTTLNQIPTVLSFIGSTQAFEGGPHVGTAQLGGGNPAEWLYQYPGILRSALESQGVGLISTNPELDGVVRRLPLAISVEDRIYPSFALEMLRLGTGDPSYQIKTEETGVEWIRLPQYNKIITSENGTVWANWNTKFHRQTALEYMENPIPAPFVIFGVTAEGVAPLVATPGGVKYPHDIQATVLNTIVNGNALSQPSWSLWAELTILVTGMIAIMIVASNIYLSLPVILVLLGGTGFTSWKLIESSYLLDVSSTIVILFLFWAIVQFRSFITQYLLRLQIKQQFGTYVSPDLVEQLQKDPSLLKLGGERKEMTFLFTDIMGFTPVSETFKNNDDPEGLVDLINTYLDSMTTIILDNGGTIDKYMGDCIMAFWNAPLPCINHADMAVKSAIEINIKTEELNKQFKEQGLGLPPINVGTGINTGTCIVGNMGSAKRFDYSVIGDAVNLAARLEATAGRNDYKEWKIIVSEDTMKESKDFNFDSIGDILVKGKSEPVEIYSIQK